MDIPLCGFFCPVVFLDVLVASRTPVAAATFPVRSPTGIRPRGCVPDGTTNQPRKTGEVRSSLFVVRSGTAPVAWPLSLTTNHELRTTNSPARLCRTHGCERDGLGRSSTGRDSHDRLGGRVPSMSMDRMHRHGECRSRGDAPSGRLPLGRRTAGCGKLRVRSVGGRRSRARPTETPAAARG